MSYYYYYYYYGRLGKAHH